MSTRQTTSPVSHITVNQSGRSPRDLVRSLDTGDLTIDTPYQRGAVWNDDQRVQLIYSLMSGIPIPALIINRRRWASADEPYYAVIDGKQRMLTFVAWFSGDLAVPASWFKPEDVEATEDTEDGPYARFTGISKTMQRFFGNASTVAVAEASLPSVQAEAEVFLRVNGYGTPQSNDDMARAARVATTED